MNENKITSADENSLKSSYKIAVRENSVINLKSKYIS